MWLKFIKDCETNESSDVVWIENDESAIDQINSGNAVRCLSHNGEIFEDSTPEDIIKQLASEDDLTFEEEEIMIQEERKLLTREKRSRASLGNFVDVGYINNRKKYREDKIRNRFKN